MAHGTWWGGIRSARGTARRAAWSFVLACAAACVFPLAPDALLLSGTWRQAQSAPPGTALDLTLVQHDDGRLAGTGEVSLGGPAYPFVVDAGTAAAYGLRFDLRGDTDPFGSFTGTVSRRNEIVGSLYIGTTPDGRIVQGVVDVRLVRVSSE